MTSYASILKTQNYVAPKWLQDGVGTLEVVDKYDASSVATIPLASAAQMEAAIVAAQAGFREYSRWSAGERSRVLLELREALAASREEFARLIVAEAGKPLSYARNEIDRCLVTLATAEAEALRFTGETVPIDYGAGTGRTAFTKRYPLGIVGCITPFNFPLNLVLHKVAPALAVGCSMIVKPAPQAPLSTLALAGLIDQIGLPAGVFSVLSCDVGVAEKLVTDPRVAMLSFTGSAKVGWHLKSICGTKKVALELGGNAAVIVDASADVAEAASSAAKGSFLYAGQICISTQRIYVVDAVYDHFIAEFLRHVEALPVGDPSQESTLVGPLIDRGHFERVGQWVEEARASGAEILAGGRAFDSSRNIYEPTVLTNTDITMKVCNEEVFGPVAVVERVGDFSEAIRRTNDSIYGLQAGVFTNDFAHVRRAHEELEVGAVIVNNIPGFRIDSMPYGGVKNSGLGREGIRYAMEEMSEPRLLVY